MTSIAPVHSQRIRPARLGVLLLLLAVVEGLGGAAMNFTSGPIWAVLLMGGLMLLFAWLTSVFWELRIEIGGHDVLLGWGWPLQRHLKLAEIKGARVAPYKALRFGGWGWRMGTGGAWAYSDIGIKEALVLELASGKLIYVTLKDPQAAAQAVAQALAGAASPAE